MDDSHQAITAEKKRVRAAVRNRRSALSADERRAAGDAITARLIELITEQNARSVSCYLALPTEPDTTGFLAWAAENDIDVLLPSSLEGHRLGWIRPDGTGTTPGAHGISEPNGELLPGTAVGAVDLMLIPASAVDLNGMRMGWGLGYYDRCLATLERKPPIYAIVHDADVLERVPAEPHDSPIDGAITPSRTYRFTSRGEGKI